MPRMKLNQPVNAHPYGITTIAQLLDEGKAYVRRVEHWGKNEVVKYLANLVDENTGEELGSWIIGQKAYESRAAKGQNVNPVTSGTLVPDPSISFDEESLSLIIDGQLFACEWMIDMGCFRVQIDNEYLGLLRSFALDVYEVQAVNPLVGNSSGVYVDFNPPTPFWSVVVPATPQHEGIYVKTVKLFWRCPVCGHLRGDIFNCFSYDGSRRLIVNGWHNPCNHIDKYNAVILEAQNA